jgi:hypothetical protein
MPNKNHNLQFVMTKTIKDIPQDCWDKLFGQDIIESYGYHKTLEESNLMEIW